MDDAENLKKITQWSKLWLQERALEVSELTSRQVNEMYDSFVQQILDDKHPVPPGESTRMLIILGMLACRRSAVADQKKTDPVLDIPSSFKDILS